MIDDGQRRAIRDLANEAGVLTEWVDAWNEPQRVSSDDLLAVLSALAGRELDSRQAIETATREMYQTRPAIEPVLVAWDGALPAVHVDFPVRDATLVLEDGSEVAVAGEAVSGARRLGVIRIRTRVGCPQRKGNCSGQRHPEVEPSPHSHPALPLFE